MLPRNTTNEQAIENDNQINRGNRIISTGARRGVPNYPDITIDHITNSSASFAGRSPVSRSNVDLETALYSMEFYYPVFHASIGRTSGDRMATAHDDHLGGDGQNPSLARRAGYYVYGYPDFDPRSGEYPYVGNPLSTEDLFELRAQDTNNGYQPSGTPTAVSNPYSQDLQPGNNDIPSRVANVHAGTTPDSSTVPEHVTTGYSPSPNLPNPSNSHTPDSQEVGVVVWSLAGDDAPVRRSRKRRKMTDDELVRNRALKAAGGACDNCRRRKKRCRHKDDQLILPAPTPSASAAPEPGHHVPMNVNNSVGTRTVHTRPRPDNINRRVLAARRQQRRQQRHNPSIASSCGRSVDPSMFSDGGTSSIGTMTSTQSETTTFVIDEYNPAIQPEEQFGLDAAGLGQQFNGQLAQQFTSTNIMDADNEIRFLNVWLDGEHPGGNDH